MNNPLEIVTPDRIISWIDDGLVKALLANYPDNTEVTIRDSVTKQVIEVIKINDLFNE